MTQLTNKAGFGLAMAVWLAHDEYTSGQEEHPGKDVISATTLLKPTRQLILGNRMPDSQVELDVADLIPSSIGTAIHDSIEHAWHNYEGAMKRLGYPQKVIDRVRINPETVEDGTLPVYLEQRYFREVEINGNPVIISGKFDQIIDGELNDTKTTSVYTYIHNKKEEDYVLQGSIYRWINPDKVTSDIMRIQHVFTDHQRSQIGIQQGYPEHKVAEFKVQLMEPRETERWIKNKIHEILENQNKPEPEIIRCSDKDLWMTDPVYKYYSDPATAAKGGRSTKNFPNYVAAAAHCKKAGKGVVITVPGTPKACAYCRGAPLCTQRLEYNLD
jgi:hypothetical protein